MAARRERYALLDGVTIAEADKDDLVRIEGNWYWPPVAVTEDALAESPTPYTCPWKGECQYFTVTASNTAVIQNDSGVIQYNAFQQDMTMFRIVFRVGWEVINPLNYSEATEADRYPAAVLRSPDVV